MQNLVYENVPFRCRRCHAYGHPASDCILPKHSKFGLKKKGAVASGEEQNVKSAVPQVSAHISVGEQVNEMLGEDNIIASTGRVDAISELSEQVQAQEHVTSPKDPSGSGTSTFSLSPNVNLFMNNVTFLGFDWIEGLRNLSLSIRSSFSMPLLVSPPFPVEDELGLISPPGTVITAIAPDLCHAIEEPSSVILEPDPDSSPVVSCPSHSESSDSSYFLRSRTKLASGLAKVPTSVRRGRGRKTNHSKAQSRAKEDFLDGKQHSIESALRAKKAKKRGRK